MSVSQTEFRAALLDPDRAAPQGLGDGRGAAAGRRFAVYRNNVAVSLTEALETGFPTVAKLIGAENFRHLAGLFLRAHPPESPLMMVYGARLPDFIAGIGALSHLGYLPDVARLDLALRQSYHAADATPVAADALQAIAPEDLGQTRLTLAPALRLLNSRWPLHGIYRFNHEDGAPKPEPRAEAVLVTRPDYDPVPRLLPPAAPPS
ncbi:putative DNA-binding domain-containing protein [Pseudooceanicola sp. LIPI14-2-Ac024]|uniref:HvfC/BufC family peptide modification chaperone n=1 Tax=Pseudooceanicola sp. LIPI14-2-Ac024 TaxID=3344875 RepID=UPI0035D04DFA